MDPPPDLIAVVLEDVSKNDNGDGFALDGVGPALKRLTCHPWQRPLTPSPNTSGTSAIGTPYVCCGYRGVD
jgi:hypothetical protein